ncbi:MAG: hypothetical protein IKO27_03170 [Ruminococcus sp.]|nr:hypothetical protein [Ruminococcus sp.]
MRKRIAAAAAALLAAFSCVFCAYAAPEQPEEPESSVTETTEVTSQSETETETSGQITKETTADTSVSETETTEQTTKETTADTSVSETETTEQTTKETTAETVTRTETETTAQTTEQTAASVSVTETEAASQVTSESQSETEKETDLPAAEPSKVSLIVGDIKNDEFDVSLNMILEMPVTSASIKIEYDSSLMQLADSTLSDAPGGMPVEKIYDGSYSYKYINPNGTSYSGVYATLHFKITDTAMTSSVIYVTVESLEDKDLLDVPNIIQNGIVKYRETDSGTDSEEESRSSDSSEDERPVINIKVGELPVMLEELGIPDVNNIRTVKVLDTALAVYEQGALSALAPGETELILKYSSGKELRFRLIVAKADPAAPTPDSSIAEEKEDTSGRNLCISAAVMFAIAAVALEYVFIMKPFKKKPMPEDDGPDGPNEGETEEFVAYDDDDAPEMVQNPEEVFARRMKPEEKQIQRAAQKAEEKRPQKQAGRPSQKPEKKDAHKQTHKPAQGGTHKAVKDSADRSLGSGADKAVKNRQHKPSQGGTRKPPQGSRHKSSSGQGGKKPGSRDKK